MQYIFSSTIPHVLEICKSITQYGSSYCVYRDGNGLSSIKPYIRKFQFSFHFQFNLTSNDIKVENMSKSNSVQKMDESITRGTKYR